MKVLFSITLLIGFISSIAQTKIQFGSGESNLTLKATKVLDSLLLTVVKDDVLKISGHTDTIGSSDSNIILSEKRALSVNEYLLKNGESNNIDILFTGESDAKYSSNEQNRRVEIVLLKAKTSVDNPPTNINAEDSNELSIEQFKNSDNINLKNIQFKPGTAEFYNQAALDELRQLRIILRELSNIKIRIEGHVCCVADHTLSELRAKKVLWYLTDNGISKDRLSSVGFSNTKPLVPETSAENNQKNRRVEVSIVER